MSHETIFAATPPLPPYDEVHVWHATLDVSPHTLAVLAATLTVDEQHRAAQRVRIGDRNRFIAARGMLRALLARSLGCAPDAVVLHTTAHGKPTLEAPLPAGAPLCFNLSHSHTRVLYALARGREVGIDIERCRPMRNMAGMVCRYFTPAEQAMLAALPPARQEAAFFNAWTRKEAYLKACGRGLAHGLAQVEVTLEPGAPAVLLRGVPGDKTQWGMVALEDVALAGYAATLVVEEHTNCPAWRVRQFFWEA